ncbi:MAG: NAD(P)-binding protein, partial [Candidatus Hodarchaeales archaeon]
MTKEYECFIAGGGLGGLLSASLLSKYNKRVFLAERLRFFGGRFTGINHDGFQVSTGAVHMIPHGNRGPFGLLLRKTLG